MMRQDQTKPPEVGHNTLRLRVEKESPGDRDRDLTTTKKNLKLAVWADTRGGQFMTRRAPENVEDLRSDEMSLRPTGLCTTS